MAMAQPPACAALGCAVPTRSPFCCPLFLLLPVLPSLSFMATPASRNCTSLGFALTASAPPEFLPQWCCGARFRVRACPAWSSCPRTFPWLDRAGRACNGIDRDIMTSLAEMFSCRDGPNLPSYSETEGGVRFNYQVSMAVRVNLDDARQRKLESHFNHRNGGYEACVCNRSTNVVTISKLEGVQRNEVMRYIRKRVDPNAQVVA